MPRLFRSPFRRPAGPRGIFLTRDGQQFQSAVSLAFGLIVGAAESLRSTKRKGTLRIWCMPGLATRWLTPRLSQIEGLLPQVEIVLRASDEAPNLEQSEADVMIGFGDLDNLPPDAVRIAHPRMFPVARPEWVAKNPDRAHRGRPCPWPTHSRRRSAAMARLVQGNRARSGQSTSGPQALERQSGP
ncbi:MULTISPECIES: LysR substrate-binding domain-containing protein [unclassified Mesorhizobium]|uniref:LysR substrate-binding domain-containing protein n=1 Tax=Mesorhizobium sp. M00.F.Ca.ET.217.01.1.1 TaxID=2500529 RepID=UPI000FDA236B|nr:hypothetical protein EN860_030690 [Mesorhizobium sp. M00.F.Ca.ET.217.01.1.1]TGV85461.1 hypothetical protein EN801_029395 [Mesorhizobium sp. M00.F.Ca.ET.158.01.1.1]